MIIGYARVSTFEQNLDLQLDALRNAGAERIFEDKASGARDDRPGLAQALSHLRPGDVLLVWKLDRLGRTMRRLIELIEDLAERDINFDPSPNCHPGMGRAGGLFEPCRFDVATGWGA